jgi:4-hydroxy-tetrahydrodipicolinate synthase
MKGTELAGVFAAAVTPLRKDFAPDVEAVAPFLSFLADRGCHGALLLGTTGEGPSFSPAERGDLWQAATQIRRTRPDFLLMAGTGTPSLTETIDLTKKAFDLGFDAVVTLPPYYFRSAPDEGLFRWFEQLIVQAVPADGLLLGYHFPRVAGIGFSLELLARLKDAFPRQFVGIKDSSHDAAYASEVATRFGSDLKVFCGTDTDFSTALNNHAAGCITAPANILSPDLRRVYDAFVRGSDGSQVQAHISLQRHILEKFPPFAPTLKMILARRHKQPRWPVRPPLVELPAALEDSVLSALQNGRGSQSEF